MIQATECLLEKIGIELIWSDSLGAKSFSIVVKTSNGYIIVDPGAAALQPSYPMDNTTKRILRRKAIRKIREYLHRSHTVIITHYHHDHFTYPDDKDLSDPDIYNGRKLIIKNPNKYINRSQWSRSRRFIEQLLSINNMDINNYLTDPREEEFPDPVHELEYALRKNFGDYNKRRSELLEKGSKWFKKLVEFWSSNKWISEIRTDNLEIVFGDNTIHIIDNVEVRIYKPLFHGVEYDKTGWVTPILFTIGNYKVFYSSDLMGPIIEDYAHMIIDAEPDIVFLDGPPIYLYPYMFNKINLQRAISNLKIIVDELNPELIIYDHHVTRSVKWRRYLGEILEYSAKKGVPVLTMKEYMEKCGIYE